MENAPFEYSKSESAFLLLLRQSFRFAARMLTLYFTTRRRCLQVRGIKIGQILLFCEEKKQILFCAFEEKNEYYSNSGAKCIKKIMGTLLKYYSCCVILKKRFVGFLYYIT